MRLRPHHPQTLQVDLGDNGTADFQVDRHRFNAIRVATGAGDDSVRIDESNGQFTRSDRTTVDGGTGHDTLVFDGPVQADAFRLSPSGRQAMLTHDAGAAALALSETEQVDVASIGGNHALTVDDLRGTGITGVANDLASVPGRATSGAAVAQTIVNGTVGDDTIVASGGGAATTVHGLAATVQILHADTRDDLTIAGLAGNDRIDATGLQADAPKLAADGGAGNDTILGGAAPTTSSAVTATTSSTATVAPTRSRSARAMTASSGIPGTAATSSRAATAMTSWPSTVRPPPSGSSCPRTARTRSSRVTLARSGWISLASSRSTSPRSAATTT